VVKQEKEEEKTPRAWRKGLIFPIHEKEVKTNVKITSIKE